MKKYKILTWIITSIGFIVGVLYYPFYVIGWVMHKIFRFGLAISYFLMFRWRMAIDILKHLFKAHE